MKGNYPEALRNYHEALKLFTELNDRSGIGRAYNNMGNAFNGQKNYSEALRNFFAAMAIKKELNDKNGLGGCLCNIGLMYFNKKQYDSALYYYQQAREILKDGGNKQFLATSIDNMGDVMQHTGHYEAAENLYLEALKMRQETSDSHDIGGSYTSLANLYYRMGKYKQALAYGKTGYEMALHAASLKRIQDATFALQRIYDTLGDYRNFSIYYKEYIAARDSLYNAETERKMVEQQMLFDFDKKEALARADQAKKEALNAERLVRERNARIAATAGAALLLIIAVIAFYAFWQKRKDNSIIQKLVNEQELVIAARTKELARSNEGLASANRKLVDLIQYNAHQVREPLTRITGVIGIIDCFTQQEFTEEVWPMIEKAVTDLDNNIMKVVAMADATEAELISPPAGNTD